MSERPSPHDASFNLPPLKQGNLPGNISRRRLFGIMGGLVAASIVGVSKSEEIEEGVEFGIGTLPEVLYEVAQEPHRALDAWRLWEPQELVYKKSPFLKAPFMYTSSKEENVIIAVGDSNMVGSGGKNRAYSPVRLFAEEANQRLGTNNWIDVNIAHSGATTTQVKEQLLSDEARDAFSQSPQCDVWVNAGGNDLSAAVRNREEMEEVEKLKEEDLLDNPELLLKYASRMMDNLRSFRTNFSNLLDTLGNEYGSQIRHLVIMSVPDFSQAPAITSQYIEDKAYKLPLENDKVKDLVHSISIIMNNEMFAVAQEFHEKTGIRIVGIDTFENSQFGDDQHLTVDALVAIADQAVGRIEMAA